MAQTRKILFARIPGPVRDALFPPAVAKLARERGYEVSFYPETDKADPAQWPKQLEDKDALITTWGAPRLTKEVLGNTKLKIVGHAAGSVAMIVSGELYDRGIKLVSANPMMAQVVAEYSMMMTLVGRTKLHTYAQIEKNPLRWGEIESAQCVAGSIVSIWGYGDIARRLINFLRPFEVTILIHSNSMSDQQAKELGVEKVEFDELFTRGDVIHLLGALTPSNKHRVSTKQLAAIRDGATLINAGRADLVEPSALLEACRQNRFTTILDVHYDEPLPDDSPFRGLPGVILTPHSAGHPGRERYVPFILNQFDHFFRGEPIEGEITRERAQTMTDETLMKK